MTQFFIQLLNVSIASSWLIGAVLLVRLIIKGRSPRWIACLLWGLVALRLVVPFSVESPFSLVPETPEITLDFSEEAPSETESILAPPVSEMGNTSRPEEESSETEESEPSVPSEDSFAEPSEEPSFEPSYSEEPSSEPSEEPDVSEESYEESSEEESQETSQESSEESSEESEESEEESLEETSEESIPAGMMGSTSTPGNPSHGSGISFATTASGIWLAGVLALAGYALVNYLILKKRVLVFVPDERGFRRCEGIDTPFVLGFFRPRIYLPYGLSTASEPYIIAHEKAHIKRMDHLVKPIAYCILALHWFNPLVWLAFVLFCKDIEYACDEKVLKNAAADIRKEYATALLECASKRSFLAACPIAFGEVSVKERVKKTMNYKRPLLWVIIVSVLLCALVAVLFFTAPMDEESAPNTPSEEQTSSEASTELSTEESTESSTEESSVTEPSEPEESQPDESEPDESEPDVSEPEVSEPEDSEPPVEIVKPEEKETTLEKVLSFDIGIGGIMEYNFMFYDDPSSADVIVYGSAYTDGNGVFYQVADNELIRVNDGAKFPFISGSQFYDIEIMENDFYVLKAGNTGLYSILYHYDVSTGFETPTLIAKYDNLPSGSLGLIDGTPIVFEQGKAYDVDGRLLDESEMPYVIKQSENDSVTVRMENNLLTIYQGESFYCYVPAASGFRTAVAESKRKGSDNTIYSSYDRIGNIKNRFSHTVRYPGVTVSCKLDYTWGNEVYTVNAYTPVRTMIGGQTFENLLQGRVFFDVYGNAYYAAYYLDHCDLYRINMGYSDIQLTDQPEPSDELPPEEELSMELALRFGCGPDYPISLWAYTNGYPEFGELIMEESIFTDGKGNFYKDVYNGILRINDGVKLSKDSVVRGTANGSKYVLSGGDSLWYEDRYLNEDIYILQNENKEVVSRIKVSIEQPYQYQPCEIRYWTNEYSGNYATVRYYRPYTIKVNEVIFENVVEYQIFHGKEGTLYLVMFFAEHGEIYAITGGVTHEAATPATEETDDRNLPILFEIYYEEQDDLRQLLNDPLGDHLGRGYEIPINHKLLYYMEATPVLLSEEFVELATDFAAMEAYLKGQGFSCKVTDIVVFSAETAPVTLMALTEAGNAYFVTAKIDYPTKEQVYAAYTLEDYRNTFLSREVKVVVNGTEMTPKYPVTAYGENTMLPIVQVLQALGGTVEQVDGGVSITLDGKQCFVYFGEHCIMYGDEEWAYGWEVEYHRDELLIPRGELQSIFDVFCPGVEIRVDIANNAVYIERKASSEKETTMELVDEIPVNDPRSPIFLQYNIGESFYGQIITPTRFLVDLNEDIYCVVGEGLFRLRDSEGFRLIDPNDTGDRSVSSVAVYNGTIYVAYKSFSGQKGELVAYDITGKVLSSAALPAAKYGEYYYLFISEDGKPKVLFGNDIYSHTGQKVGVLNAEADVTYGVTIGGVTHSMTNEPLILSRLGGVSTIREIQEKWYGTDPAKRHCIREEIFHQYDKAGNLVSEFKLTEFSCGKDIPCHVAIGEAVCTSVSLETVTIGENVFEGVYSCRVVPGADGKLYAILIYTDGTRIYRIDPGYSDVEFRDLDAIENPKAECLICKAPAPAEKETTLEKVFTFDIGPNGVMEYNFFFEGDPSKGNIRLPGDFFADGDGNYYFAVGDRLIRLNDGAVLPKRCVNFVIDVEICGNTLYMLDSIGTAYQLDISNGFAAATLEAEYPVFRYGYDSSGSLIRYGDTVLYQSWEGLLYTLDKTLLTGNSAPYQFVTGNEVFVTLDRDTATLLINKNANENISVRAITSAGISISDYTDYMMDVENMSQAIFSTYDLSGKATSRFMMTTVYQSESAWGWVEFHYGDGLKTTIVYRPQDIMVGKKIFEDVLKGRMYCGMDGNFYFVAYHVNRADVYLVNAG